MAKLKITQIRSTIGRLPKHRRTIEALGLRRLGDAVEQDDTAVSRGMIRRVNHLVQVEELSPSEGGAE